MWRRQIAHPCGQLLEAWRGGRPRSDRRLTIRAAGHIEGYGTNGWAAVALVLLACAWISRVKAVDEPVSPASLERAGVQANR
ncbi:MAG: hypothetical protein EPN73_01550 [Paraburkholderia sp.]|uniref:hypothetical protein n=1 Tax=Paraburkholderia sp. TaxID=1926495 RepID=UPI00120F84D0|nr:hypothetical protein [Paraburkholderia sp.]TAL98638.1 MAG: hypothetical protein EPN73_01550 [Paraburkholderia sp.]